VSTEVRPSKNQLCAHFSEEAIGARLATATTEPFQCPYCKIERLELEIHGLRSGDNAEIERLRAALGEILETERLARPEYAIEDALTIARKALEAAPPAETKAAP
jgi:hypothetical protein